MPTATLASTDLHAHVATTAQLGARLGSARTVQNLDRDRGVTFDRGPRIEDIERVTGPLGRVRIEDSLPVGAATTPAPAGRPAASPGGYRPAPLADAAKRAAEQSAREADALSRQKAAAPGVWKLVRPIGVPGRGTQPAAGDSTP